MKSPLKTSVAAVPSRNTGLLRGLALGSAALMGIFTSTPAFGQGGYYPVSPTGAPYGSNYNGITVAASPDLTFLQNNVQNLYGPNVSLQVPLPTGSTAPTTVQYSQAVAVAVTLVLAGSPTVPAGVTLTSLSNEAVSWNSASAGTTTTAIAQSIVQFNTATAVANLTTVAAALAKSQPTLINNLVANIVVQAGTNTTIAAGIPQIVAAAVTNVPNNTTAITSIVNNGVAYGIATSSLTAQNKADLFTGNGTYTGAGYIQTLLAAGVTNNRPATVDAITSAVTFTNFLTVGNLPGGAPALTTILNSVVAGIPAGSLSNTLVMGAVADGALRSQGALYGASGGAIATALDANAATAAYTDMVVNGYSNSSSGSAAFGAYVAAHASFSDALAAGAVVKASLTPALVLQLALVNGSAAPRNVVASAVGANQTAALTTLVGAINSSNHTPWAGSFGDIAYGGAEAAPLATAGNVTQTVLLNSATSVTALNTGTVTQVMQNALNGANAGGNQAAFAALIYGVQLEAKYTSPGTVSNPGIAAVQTAVDTLTSIANPLYPSFIAPVAAVAGDTYGYNQANIVSAGNTQLTTDSGDTVAAIAGENLVASLRASAATTYTSMLTAFNNASTNASPSNSAIALLYGATLQDPTEYAAELASAIKQSTVSDATLTAVANNALLPSSGLNLSQNVQVVDTVATHFKTEATGSGINDLFGYVSHQIVVNSSLTQAIAAAAVVIDPDSAHFVAHAVAFQNPSAVYLSVPAIFTYTQITNPHPVAAPTAGFPGGVILGTKSAPGSTPGAVVDQPAAAAAITAALTTGILEANASASVTQTNLVNAITAAVAASATQNGINLVAPLHPFYNSAVPGDSTAIFQQSNGNGGTISNYQTVGPAGAVTGFVAQMVKSGDSTINSITAAVLTAATAANVRAYALPIAQAAAQAFAWVSGYSTVPVINNTVGNPVFDIANAIAPTVAGFATLAQLETAVAFGITLAENGTIGAGALGLNAVGINSGSLVVKSANNTNGNFYQVRSATGTPVTDIFNL